MELQVLMVVRKGGSKYLLVEDHSKKLLHFPTQSASASQSQNDVKMTAQLVLDEVLCITAKLKGILKVIHKLPPPGSISSSSICIVIVAEELKSKSDLGSPKIPYRWLTKEEIASTSEEIDSVSLGLISHLEAGVPPLPLELMETLDAGGVRKISGTLERQMLEEANYGPSEFDQISDQFVQYCGTPSGLMTFMDFKKLMKKLGLPDGHIKNCFRSLSTNGLGITLEELQVGLCALDPATPHGAIPGQLRCQFIFKHYNTSATGFLTYNEFKDMYRDITVQKKMSLSDREFEQSLAENWDHFGIPSTSPQGVSMSKFLTIVGQLKFRGTSVLFRLPQSPIKRNEDPYTYAGRPTCPSPIPVRLFTPASPGHTSKEAQKDDITKVEDMDVEPSVDKTIESKDNVVASVESSFPSSSAQHDQAKEQEEKMVTYDDTPFTIATHSVKVRRSGALSDVHTLWELVGTGAMSGSVEEILEHHKPSFDRLPSINAFDKTSKSNEMLSGLRYFEHPLRDDGRGKTKRGLFWGAIDMASVARCFITICQQAVNVCSSEPRLLEVKSPCYVLGDLHGNFHDLVCFEKVLWRMGPILTPASFLFLGDYVDRGEFGFEVIAYLFAQKLLMPNKFLLIRGNHEIRAVQESFTYKTECLEKFGQELGEQVWEATNKVFDTMPIAAVIDSKIFCVHGGIPHYEQGGGYIQAINNVPKVLPNPADDCALAWDIMWNDPVKQEDETGDESLQQELLSKGGFIDNDSRGTGHAFSAQALDEFLKRNNLSHVIRAHEVKEAGFQLQQNGRLLTVFSSSHYCGSTNEAACVLVDNRKIRTIRLDTRS